MKTTHHFGTQLIGETVTISYVADPLVGHGQFRLENPGDTEVVAIVKLAWLELGRHQQQLANIKVFDLHHNQPINPKCIKVSSEAVVKFLIGFPSVAHEPRFGDSAAVGLLLSVNGIEMKALSPFKFVRRIPQGK